MEPILLTDERSISTARAQQFETAIVSTDAEFDRLEEEWKALAEMAHASVFQTYEWVRPWWAYLGKGKDLHIVLFRLDGTLIGIAPLLRERHRFLGVTVSTRLQFLGTPISDYSDIIIRPGMESAVLAAFARYLRTTAGSWDVFDMEDVNERSPAQQLLPGLLGEHGIAVHAYQGNVCPERVLPTNWDAFLLSVGPNLRNNLKRKYRRLQEAFTVELETVPDDPEAIRGAIEDFARIHGERWNSLGYPSAFDEPHHREFHTEISRRFARRGWLRLMFLKVNGKRIAVIFDFNYKKRIYMYQSNAFGTDEVMKYSPGMLIKGMAMEEGIKEGMEVFDFLRGDEPYKYEEWKAVNSKNWLIRGASPAFGAGMRFKYFLLTEFLEKSYHRILREFYDLRRFRRSKSPTLGATIGFVVEKLGSLVKIGLEYAARHLPRSPRGKSQEDRSMTKNP